MEANLFVLQLQFVCSAVLYSCVTVFYIGSRALPHIARMPEQKEKLLHNLDFATTATNPFCSRLWPNWVSVLVRKECV